MSSVQLPDVLLMLMKTDCGFQLARIFCSTAFLMLGNGMHRGQISSKMSAVRLLKRGLHVREIWLEYYFLHLTAVAGTVVIFSP